VSADHTCTISFDGQEENSYPKDNYKEKATKKGGDGAHIVWQYRKSIGAPDKFITSINLRNEYDVGLPWRQPNAFNR
jgi:hypothetical protein